MPITARTPLGEPKHYTINRNENTRVDETQAALSLKPGAKQPLKDGALMKKTSISDLRRDLDRLKARTGRATEAPKAAVSLPNDSLELRLQDLVLKHQSSKAKHTAEIDAVKQEHAITQASYTESQRELSSAKEQNRKMEAVLASLRSEMKVHQKKQERHRQDIQSSDDRIKDLQLLVTRLEGDIGRHSTSSSTLEAENRLLRSEIAALKEAKSLDSDQNLLQLENRCKELAGENERLRNENERMSSREDKVEEMEDERDWLEYVVDFAAKQCGQEHESKVDRRDYEHVKEELAAVKMEVKMSKDEKTVLRRELQIAQEESQAVSERLSAVDQDRHAVDTMLQDLLDQRRIDRSFIERGPEEVFDQLDETVDVTDADIAGLEARHSALVTLDVQHELRQALDTYRHFLSKYESLKETLASAQSAQVVSQRQYRELEDNHQHLERTHQACGAKITGLHNEVARWQHAEQTLSSDLVHVKKELKRVSASTRSDREALKRANEGVLRSKAAEDAFEEEITQLREAFVNASEYEEMYNALLEENRELLLRESLAAEEVETLAMQNADLLGHGNGDQKISYVDSLRRDMALTKHELASTRLMLNKANDRVEGLTEEVEAYKSVNKDFGLGGSTRTRVVRRVPEGAWMSKSTRGSRSVSGPAGR